MPKNVRNFWVTANVDGRNGSVSFGPRSKDGGFSLNLKLRDEGQVGDLEINLWGRVVNTEDGEYLKLTIDEDTPGKTSEIYSIMIRRQRRGKKD